MINKKTGKRILITNQKTNKRQIKDFLNNRFKIELIIKIKF